MGITTRAVEQYVVDRDAKPAAYREEVVDLVFEGKTKGRVVFLDAGRWPVGLDAEDELAGLEVVADLATSERSLEIAGVDADAQRLHRAAGPAVAAVGADVESVPAVNRRHHGRWCRAADRKVRG